MKNNNYPVEFKNKILAYFLPIPKFFLLLIFITIGAALVYGLYTSPYSSYDWWVYPTTLKLVLSGNSPYDNAYYHNPPWTVILLAPLALLPTKLGEAFVLVIGLTAYAMIARHFGAGLFTMIVFILSPPILFDLYAGNITWLAMLGLLMPPWLGLFFVLSKPHLGIGIAIYWLVIAWRSGGIRNILKVFGPVAFAFLLSYLLFGTWFLKSSWLTEVPFNKSIFPYGIAIGLVLLYLAISREELKLAAASSPFFAPYFPLHGWGLLMIGLLPNAWLILLANLIIIIGSALFPGFP